MEELQRLLINAGILKEGMTRQQARDVFKLHGISDADKMSRVDLRNARNKLVKLYHDDAFAMGPRAMNSIMGEINSAYDVLKYYMSYPDQEPQPRREPPRQEPPKAEPKTEPKPEPKPEPPKAKPNSGRFMPYWHDAYTRNPPPPLGQFHDRRT